LVYHLWLADGYSKALSQGVPLPRWFSASNGGLGDPTGLFTYPLFYISAGILQWVGLSTWNALRVICTGAVLLSVLVFLVQTRGQLSRGSQVIGALLVALNPLPYWVLSSYNGPGWFLAFPFLTLFVTEVFFKPSPRWLIVAVSVAMMTLSHILVTFMAFVCLPAAAIAVFAMRGRSFVQSWLLPVVLGCSAGLALVAFYVVPALLSTDLVKFHDYFREGILDWRNSFALPLSTSREYGMYWRAIQWPVALVYLAGLALFALIALRSGTGPSSPNRQGLLACAMFGLVAVALASEFAFFLYQNSSAFYTLQRPLRMLTVAAVAFAVCLPFALLATSGKPRSWMPKVVIYAVAVASMLLFLLLGRSVVGGSQPLRWSAEFLATASGQPNALPATAGSQWRQYLDRGGLAAECEGKQAACAPVAESPHLKSWRIQSSSNTSIVLPLFYFPTWELTINGTPVPLGMDEATGLANVSVGQGSSLIEIRWRQSPSEVAGWAVTLGTLAVLFAVTLRVRSRGAPELGA
jgi:hypothetical protein